MIRRCEHRDFELIFAIINDGARAYKGIIPADCWTEPYMSREKLKHEIDEGVVFWGFESNGILIGVVGIQKVRDVTLIRHAYVRTGSQKQGIGAQLLSHLKRLASGPVLIGTWAEAGWAIRFYEKYGFQMVVREQKDRLLKKYWTIPERQVEVSVILADQQCRIFQPELGLVAREEAELTPFRLSTMIPLEASVSGGSRPILFVLNYVRIVCRN